MARILVDGEWYEEIASTSLFETDFEQIVVDQAASLYPDYYAIPFKVAVHTETDSAKPDLALIDRGYQEWWVVEIELSRVYSE